MSPYFREGNINVNSIEKRASESLKNRKEIV